MRVVERRNGSSPDTSYASSSPSRIRTRRGPATFTTSDSSTPSSCTLVPDSLLVDREVLTVELAMSRDAVGELDSAMPPASNMTMPEPHP